MIMRLVVMVGMVVVMGGVDAWVMVVAVVCPLILVDMVVFMFEGMGMVVMMVVGVAVFVVIVPVRMLMSVFVFMIMSVLMRVFSLAHTLLLFPLLSLCRVLVKDVTSVSELGITAVVAVEK